MLIRVRFQIPLRPLTQSIACDVKPEGALYSLFYAEASKRPHQWGKCVTCCGLLLFHIASSNQPLWATRTLRADFHTYLFSCQHVLINTQYHYPHLRLRHTEIFFSHGRSTLCCFCCFSMTKSTHCSTCVDTWYFSINIQYHSTYLLILAPIFHIQINTIKIWWHVVIDN